MKSVQIFVQDFIQSLYPIDIFIGKLPIDFRELRIKPTGTCLAIRNKQALLQENKIFTFSVGLFVVLELISFPVESVASFSQNSGSGMVPLKTLIQTNKQKPLEEYSQETWSRPGKFPLWPNSELSASCKFLVWIQIWQSLSMGCWSHLLS